MNSEPKAFASLSSGLLARKGAARPAMRPQGFGQGAGLDDLGWNDMGFEAPKAAIVPVRDEDHDAFGEQLPEPALRNPLAALTPVASPVHDQQAEIADRFAAADHDAADAPADGDDYIDETAELYEPGADAAGNDESAEEISSGGSAGLSPLSVKATSAVTPVTVAPVAEWAPVPVTFRPQPEAAVHATPVRPRKPRAAAGSKGKAAFTLRLDGERHLKLRLACAVGGRSAQQLVTEALDALLSSMPELDGMAERAPKKKAG